MRSDLFVYDTETTSVDSSSCGVVQLAYNKYSLGSDGLWALTSETNYLCKPLEPITPGAEEVHKISNEMVENERPDKEVVRQFYDRILERSQSVILAGHNVKGFDERIIWRVSGQLPLDLPCVDTLTLVTRLLPDAPDHKLGNLIKHLKLGDAENAHDALADIRMCFDLIQYICNLTGRSVEELAAWCAIPQTLQVIHFGKFKGKAWEKVPFWYAKFIMEKFDKLTPDLAQTLKFWFKLNARPDQLS